ncbi:hypothetical protein H1R20_g7708, partial [Candolleomyces eurysporus]
MASPYAFVTLISSDSYLPGALAQVAALRDLESDPNLTYVCLVTPETVDVSTIKLLRKTFDLVVGVEVLEDEDKRGLQLLGRPDLATVLTKLHVFRLVQFSKIVFLDADVLPLRSLSHLFQLPHEFSAAPDVGWPDIFNSGVLVFTPGEDKFNELNDLLKSKGTWDGGDQGLLNEWRGNNWNRLSFTYNTTPTAAYTYAPAYERFGSEISALHFIGKNKPWNSIAYRVPFTSRSLVASDPAQQAYDYDSLVDRWYAVYDKHYRSEPIAPGPSFRFEKYTSVWDEPNSSSSATPVDSLDLNELKQLAIQGIAVASNQHQTGEGKYITPAFEDERWKKPRKTWDDRLEESGRDGDDEDNADDEDENDDFEDDTKWDESDEESNPPPSKTPAGITTLTKGKKDYRDQAIQATPQVQDQATQAGEDVIIAKKIRRSSMKQLSIPAGNFLKPPSTRDAAISTSPLLSTGTAAPKRPARGSIRSGSTSPSFTPHVRSPMRSPTREFIVPVLAPQTNGGEHHLRPAPQLSIPPARTNNRPFSPNIKSPPGSRQVSNESSITSPGDSSGAHTPLAESPLGGPVRVSGRVWDPARGVEIFKRGSEEVLARFLRMGSWENETVR